MKNGTKGGVDTGFPARFRIQPKEGKKELPLSSPSFQSDSPLQQGTDNSRMTKQAACQKWSVP